jgi:hypothetical protein
MLNPKEKRYEITINFLSGLITKNEKILDLGTPNELSQRLETLGYSIENTPGADLDLSPEIVKNYNIEVVTAFEILEHLVAPFNVLKAITAKKLVATVPLKLWFSNAYRSPSDPWDRHFHEFEDWQFDWLLEKAGWTIIERKKWISPSNKIGIRPILRSFIPRYYAVYAERK